MTVSILPSSIADPIAAKRVAPLLDQLRYLALRRGDGGMPSLANALLRAARGSSGSSTAAAPSSSQQQQQQQQSVLRCGPEDIKSTFAGEGILLSGAQVAELLQVFRDQVGYVLVGPLLDALVVDVLRHAGVERIVVESFGALSGQGAPSSPSSSALNRCTAALMASSRRSVSASRILALYDSAKDPRVACGLVSSDRAQSEFVDGLLGGGTTTTVSELEFVAYQAAVALQLLAKNDNGAVSKWSASLATQFPFSSSGSKGAQQTTTKAAIIEGGEESSSRRGNGPASSSLGAPRGGGAGASHQQSSSGLLFSGTQRSGSQSPRGVPVSDAERLRWSQQRPAAAAGGAGTAHNPHIVGYVGHLPTAVERFGETFQATDIAITIGRKEDRLQRTIDQELRSTIGRGGGGAAHYGGGYEDDEQQMKAVDDEAKNAFNPRCPPVRREGNKSNNHSFRMS